MSLAPWLWWWNKFSDAPEAVRARATIFIVIVGFAGSLFLTGELSHSKIGLVDESDLAEYVGTQGHLTFTQIPNVLMRKTEIGRFGQSPRFRPILYLTRLTETALFGLEGSYWYTWRVVMFGVVFAAMFWLYVQFTGLLLGAIFTAFTLSFSMWVDIWTRSTSVSEQYTAFGTAIFAVGAFKVADRWRMRENLRTSVLILAFGAFIAIGSKENMLILELPVIATLLVGVKFRRLDWISILALVVTISMGCLVASSILVFFSNGVVEDIYGNSIRASLFRNKWIIVIYAVAILSAIEIFLIDRYLTRQRHGERRAAYRKIAKYYVVSSLIVAFAFLFNFVFYSGLIPSATRYDFPALLALPVYLILLLRACEETLKVCGASEVRQRDVGVLMSLVLIGYTVLAPWSLRSAAHTSVVQNTAFDTGLRRTVDIARRNPDWPVFTESFNWMDYEPIQSIAIFLTARGVTNPRYLIYLGHTFNEPRNSWQTRLENGLVDQSKNGDKVRGFLSLALPDQSGRCFVIALRNRQQLLNDRANGKDPLAKSNCVLLPLLVYWSKGRVFFRENDGLDNSEK